MLNYTPKHYGFTALFLQRIVEILHLAIYDIPKWQFSEQISNRSTIKMQMRIAAEKKMIIHKFSLYFPF